MIVDYIINPNCEYNPVEIIRNEILNEQIIQQIDMGGICLFIYRNGIGEEYVVFDLWGIVAYKTLINTTNIYMDAQVKNIYGQYIDGTKCDLSIKSSAFYVAEILSNKKNIEQEELRKTVYENIKKAYDMVFASYNYLRPYVEKIKLRLKDDQKNDNEKVSYLLGFRGKTIRVLYILFAIYNNREIWMDNKKIQ